VGNLGAVFAPCDQARIRQNVKHTIYVGLLLWLEDQLVQFCTAARWQRAVAQFGQAQENIRAISCSPGFNPLYTWSAEWAIEPRTPPVS